MSIYANFSNQFMQLLLRGTGFVTKFYFVLFLNQNAEEEILIEYNILTNLFALTTFIVGLEYYNLVNRKLASSEKTNLLTELIVYGIGYSFGTVIIIYTYTAHHSILLIMSIMCLEHGLQEIFRKLIITGHRLQASLLTLLRNSVWPIICILKYMMFGSIEMAEILIVWMTTLIAVLTIYMVYFLRHFTNSYDVFFDQNDIMIQFRQIGQLASLFFFSGVLAKAVFVVDKLLVSSQFEPSLAAAYATLSILAFSVFMIYEITVYSHFLKDIMNTVRERDYQIIKKKYFFNTLAWFGVCGVVTVFIAINYDTLKLSKIEYIFSLIALIVGLLFNALGLIYHLKIYVLKRDRELAFITLLFPSLCFVNYVCFSFFLNDQIFVIPLSISLSYVTQFIARWYVANLFAYNDV